MRGQRNMAQRKEQIKTPEEELNEMEINNLSDAEFKTLVVRKLKELSEDLSSIKKIRSETKDTLTEIKNNLQGNNIRVHEAEIQINYLEHKEAKNNQSEQEEEKRIQKNEDSISSFWDNFKKSNIHIIGAPEGEEKEQENGNLFENIVKENLPNLLKEIDMQYQEAQRVPNKRDAKRPTPRHIIIKMPEVKDNEGILKAAREKQLVLLIPTRGFP